MKRIKKLTAVLLAMVMAFSLTVFASATATATVTAADGVVGITISNVNCTDTDLDGAVLTFESDGNDFTTITISETGYTAAYASGTVTITKDSDSSTAGTLDITATDFSGYGYNGVTVTLSVPGGSTPPNNTPTASAAVTTAAGTDIAVTSFTSTDTALNGAVITFTLSNTNDALEGVTIDKTGYSAAYASGTVTITKDSDSSTAGTLVVTATDFTSYDSTASITVTLTVTTAGGGNANAVTNLDTDVEGKGEGTGKKEGGDPSKVINVILPTVSANAFNMILDPNELLKDTSYARLAAEHTAGVDFTSDPNNHLFFNQGVDSTSGKTKYGKDSVELEILNKSQIDVWVALDVEVETGSSEVTFAADDTALAAVTDAAGMKLILNNTPVKGSNTSQNTVWNATTNDKPTTQAVGSDGTASIAYKIPTIDVFKRTYDATKGYYYEVDSSKSDGTNAQFNSTKFKLTGEINKDDAWDDVGSNDVSLTLTWKVSKDQPAQATPPDPNALPTITETRKATASATSPSTATDANKTVLTYTLGAGINEMTSVKSFKFTNASNAATSWAIPHSVVAIDTSTQTITITGVAAVYNGSNWRIEFVAADGTTTKEVSFTMHD